MGRLGPVGDPEVSGRLNGEHDSAKQLGARVPDTVAGTSSAPRRTAARPQVQLSARRTSQKPVGKRLCSTSPMQPQGLPTPPISSTTSSVRPAQRATALVQQTNSEARVRAPEQRPRQTRARRSE